VGRKPDRQLDHVFCHNELKPKFRTARVAVDAIQLGLSDHAPVIVEFEMEAISQTSRGLGHAT
jgi:endonuclease/exonuclease/phosphatase family metal-dependent hydrolase